jgi:UPF0716 family protein affecting phage T7 exclusion
VLQYLIIIFYLSIYLRVEYGAQPTFYLILIIYIGLILAREHGSPITNNTIGNIIYGENPVNYYIY